MFVIYNKVEFCWYYFN